MQGKILTSQNRRLAAAEHLIEAKRLCEEAEMLERHEIMGNALVDALGSELGSMLAKHLFEIEERLEDVEDDIERHLEDPDHGWAES